MIQAIRPTSKATLKMQCLMVCKGDIDEANKLYDYFAKDMPELPDYDPVQPTWMDNTKQTASSIMAWLGENKDTLAQAYDLSAMLFRIARFRRLRRKHQRQQKRCRPLTNSRQSHERISNYHQDLR